MQDETTNGVAVDTQTATPWAFQNYKLHDCNHCGEIHDYLTRGCVMIVAFGPDDKGYDVMAVTGTPVQLERLPYRWRPVRAPDAYHQALDQDKPNAQDFDPVYGMDGQPVG